MTAHFCAVDGRKSLMLLNLYQQASLSNLCLDAGQSIACRSLRADFHCSEASGRESLAVHLVNKAPKEHLDFREPIIWGRSANISL